MAEALNGMIQGAIREEDEVKEYYKRNEEDYKVRLEESKKRIIEQ